MVSSRIIVSGKFFRLRGSKWYARGFSYGPFAPNATGEYFPSLNQLRDDFADIRRLGGSCIRVYYPPPQWVLDEAVEYRCLRGAPELKIGHYPLVPLLVPLTTAVGF